MTGSAIPGQGAPPAGTQPPAQGGQGVGDAQPQPTADNQGFWNMFPNVPEQHRPLLEPHLRETQKTITQLQQQYAPYKGFVDAGYTPDQVQGLLKFSQDFDSKPMEMWVGLTQLLQERGIIHEELDIDAVKAAAAGEPDPDEGIQQPGANGEMPNVEDMPPWAQAMVQELQSLKSGLEQDKVQARQRAEDRLLDRQLEKMKQVLQKAGYPEDALNRETLVAHVITHNGNVEEATKALTGLREGVLKGFTEQATQPGSRELEMPNGTPKAPERQTSHRDGFAVASAAAGQALRSAQQSEAQG